MSIKQTEMTAAQQQAVMTTMLDRIENAGKPKYDSEGDRDGEILPIVAGEIRHSRNGSPWVTFGMDRWYRFLDPTPAIGDPMPCVLDDEGRPLGVPDEGPLILVTLENGNVVAITANTGWNKTGEVIWE